VEGRVNNLVYGNQDPAKLAAGVEEIVRKDVGSATPLQYRILEQAAGTATVGSVLVDIGHALGSGATTPLLMVELDLPGAMPATLQAQLIRQGVGAYCGALVFAFRSAKPVAGEVGFEEHKSFGTPKFTGDPAAAARLNGAKDLARRTDKVLRSESEMGSIKVKVPRTFSLVPSDGGSLLVLGTLPRLTSMGMSATTDAREVLEVAAAVGAAL
jgi:hypothetical protein